MDFKKVSVVTIAIRQYTFLEDWWNAAFDIHVWTMARVECRGDIANIKRRASTGRTSEDAWFALKINALTSKPRSARSG